MDTILIVGGADTSRAPMAAALLGRLLAQHAPGCRVGSAGVLGHDDDPAETEARDTMVLMGLDISGHRARSVHEALIDEALLVIGIDSGTTRVLLGRFPDAAARITLLGDLAGRRRDIPDPFRMQIGAWLSYARELEEMLKTALPQLLRYMPPELRTAPEQPTSASAGRSAAVTPETPAEKSSRRSVALERLGLLLRVAAELPSVIDWSAARSRNSTECVKSPASS